jgi:hypothetical protein
MADITGTKPDTLKRYFAETIAKSRAESKSQIRKAQWRLALSGNATMLIWLGKNILGQMETPTDANNNGPLPWTDEAADTGEV